VVVGSSQSQRSEHAGKGFLAPIDIACGLPAEAWLLRAGVVGSVGMEALFEGVRGDLENGTAEPYFGGFEIEVVQARVV